ncbi:MAG: hypothetical protein H7338_07610 [Candidatus Sericytochromatia bacterium]|nr:hypothetical protein [Candidatus Sericytochromatia bacterium]
MKPLHAALIALGAVSLVACQWPMAVAIPAMGSESGATVTVGTTQRATTDRPDDVQGLQVHAFYVLPPQGADGQLDTDGTIARSMRRIQTWIAGQTGGRRLRLDTYQEVPDVTFHRLKAPLASSSDSGAVLEQIGTALQAAGLSHPQKVMLAFYGDNLHTDWTGVGGGLVGLVQLVIDLNQGAGTFGRLDKVAAHELFHALGAVPQGAPHQGRGSHATDDVHDLMYASPNTGTSAVPPFVLDAGRDDYYGHGRPDLHDIARLHYWELPSPDAVLWFGQPLVQADGPGAVAWTPTEAVAATPEATALEAVALQTLNDLRQQAGRPALMADAALRRLTDRYLAGKLGSPEADSATLRYVAGYPGDFHLWRLRARPTADSDLPALIRSMVTTTLGTDAATLLPDAGVTAAAPVVRRSGDDLWLTLGLGRAVIDVDSVRISEGPHRTYTVAGRVRRRSGSTVTGLRVGSEADLGYYLPLQEGWTPFYVSTLRSGRDVVRLRTPVADGWSGPAFLAVDGTKPLAEALGKP